MTGLRPVLLLLLVAAGPAAQTENLRGNWGATAGRYAMTGAWTANCGEPDVCAGTWTLTNLSGERMAAGSWSARKAQDEWRGSWQARVSGGRPFSGAWTAKSEASPSSAFAQLLKSAVPKMVTGTWEGAGGRSGSWSIRARAAR